MHEGEIPAVRGRHPVRVLGASPSTPRALGREAYTLDGVPRELAEPSGDGAARQVHKRRVRYRVGGCTVELSDVVADGHATRTIAVESEDAEAAWPAVAAVGLAAYATRATPGLTALLDGRPAAVRGDRRRHQLGQVPHRRTACRRRR